MIMLDKQFSFRKGKSTKNALNLITNVIYNQLDSTKLITTEQPFDPVDHQLLLN